MNSFGIDREKLHRQIKEIEEVVQGENREKLLADMAEYTEFVKMICLGIFQSHPLITKLWISGELDNTIYGAIGAAFNLGYFLGAGGKLDLDPDVWGNAFDE